MSGQGIAMGRVASRSLSSLVCGFLTLTWALLAPPAEAQAQTDAKRPNIVLILVDDAGYTDFGAYGGEIATPTIDALAARGARFSNFHATPMCALITAESVESLDLKEGDPVWFFFKAFSVIVNVP